jgi:hypothetical protein
MNANLQINGSTKVANFTEGFARFLNPAGEMLYEIYR